MIPKKILKRLTTILFGLFFFLPLQIRAEESKWSGRVNFDPVHTTFKGGGTSFNLGVNAFYNIHPVVDVGVGFGISENWKFKSTPSLPLYIDIHVDNKSEEFSPTFDFETGIGFSTKDIEMSSYYINPMVGIRYKNFGIGFGYYGGTCMGMSNSPWLSGVNLRLAYYFTNFRNSVSGKKLLAYLRKTKFIAEANFGIPKVSEWDLYAWGGYSEGYFYSTFTIGLNVAALFPLFNNFYLGPTIGFHANPSDDTYSYLDLAIRPRYEFSQFKLFNHLYPWLQLDLGGIISTGSEEKAKGLFLKPSIGLSYDVSHGKSAIELGFGYNSVKVLHDGFEYRSDKKSYFDVSLGYSF